MAELVEREGLPDVTFHDLRHVNATLLGVDAKIVSQRLGHSTTAITRDLYQHVLREMDTAAAEKMYAVFRRAGAYNTPGRITARTL
jgi:integrase